MISIKQIQNLEEKVFKTVELIKALKQDNKILKSELESANVKIEELEQIVSDYRSTYVELEEGIANAIKQLDDLDNISTTNTAALNLAKAKTGVTKEENNFLKDNSTSPTESDKEEQLDKEEEVEEIKINYSKIAQNKPFSDAAEGKSQKTSAQNGTEKNDTNQSQLDIF
ncbi:MAG: hypothetical protein FWD87_05605 [Spirochaetaceae bacterium]|nr:hypothetical protein [Spirochaetaceae bacterium]